MEIWRTHALEAEKLAAERAAAAELSAAQHEQAGDRAAQANTHLQLLKVVVVIHICKTFQI